MLERLTQIKGEENINKEGRNGVQGDTSHYDRHVHDEW